MSETPDLTRKVLGYRSWTIRPAQTPAGKIWNLESVATPYAWTRGINTAECAQVKHEAPLGACSCGLYANHDPSSLDAEIPYYAVGAVAGWGAMEVHHDGWRARYAEIIALGYCDMPGAREAARYLAEAYGVDAVPLEQLAEHVSDHASPIPPELRPPPAPVEHVIGSWSGQLGPYNVRLGVQDSGWPTVLVGVAAAVNILGVAAFNLTTVPLAPFVALAMVILTLALAVHLRDHNTP